jgi:hypothetical protein
MQSNNQTQNNTNTGNRNTNLPNNEIKVSIRSRVRNILRYANALIKEGTKTLKLSAIGAAIGTLVNAAEVLKIVNPGLYQVTRLDSVSYQSIDQNGNVENKRIYPKLEIDLSLDKPTAGSEGFQDKLSEEERTKLFNLLGKPRQEAQRGGNRGGNRGFDRGGFRGVNRGGNRGGFREGYQENNRGGFRGGNRGGFRDGFRGGNRGGFRDGFRGGNRGGFRGGNRGNNQRDY